MTISSRRYVSHIFWPDIDPRDASRTLNEGGFLVGWNLRNFRCCIAAVVTDMPLEAVQATLAQVVSKGGSNIGSEKKYEPVVLGEWVARPGEETDQHVETKRSASLWVTLVGPCNPVNTSSSTRLPKLQSLYSNGCSYGGSECIFLCYSPARLSRCVVAPSTNLSWTDWRTTQFHLSRAMQLQRRFQKKNVGLLAELSLCTGAAGTGTGGSALLPSGPAVWVGTALGRLRAYSHLCVVLADLAAAGDQLSLSVDGDGQRLRWLVARACDFGGGLLVSYLVWNHQIELVDRINAICGTALLQRSVDALGAIKHAPMGIKFDPQLAARLSLFFSRCLQAWAVVLQYGAARAAASGVVLCGILGFRAQLAVVADVVHAVCFPIVLTAHFLQVCLNVQLRSIRTLLYLFQGLKMNALRLRVDTLECDRYQLLLGTASLVVLLFLLPTFLVYLLLFKLVAGAERLLTSGLAHCVCLLDRLFKRARSEIALEALMTDADRVGEQNFAGSVPLSMLRLGMGGRGARGGDGAGSGSGSGSGSASSPSARSRAAPSSETGLSRRRAGPAIFEIVVQTQQLH